VTRMHFKHAIGALTFSSAEIDPHRAIDRTRRLMMSALPAIKLPSTHAAAATEAESRTRSRRVRHGSFVLAVVAALAVAACTGGAGLDIPIGPVDHTCHSGGRCAGL